MKICILIILNILIFEQIIAQKSLIKNDSVCLPYLTLKSKAAHKYLEKELIKNKIIKDTLILSTYNTGQNVKVDEYDKKIMIYLCGAENYNSSLRIFDFIGYLYINEVYILVHDENISYVKNMFKSNDTVNCFYYNIDETVILPAIVVGSDIELIYKVKNNNKNNFIFRRE